MNIIGNLFKGDKGIWTVFLFLCLISVVEVFSASSTLTYGEHSYLEPILGHASKIMIGLVVAIVILNIPCRYFKLVTPFMLLITYATLLWVLVGGQSINGANRVIQLPGFTFQPSEIAKGTMVLATAQILSAMQKPDGSGADPLAMKYILWLVVPAVGLIGIENLSTGILLFAVIFAMMFIGRVPLVQMGKLTGVLTLLVGIFLGLIVYFGSNEKTPEEVEKEKKEMVAKGISEKEKPWHEMFTHRFGTWSARFLEHLNSKDVPPEEYNVKKNYQVGHANLAIASAGIVGKGPGNSDERDYLPQAYSDFIYAIIIEEM